MSLPQPLTRVLTSLSPTRSSEDSKTDVKRVAVTALCSIAIGCVIGGAVGGLDALPWGFASLAVGGFVGLLFGIPRVVQESPVAGNAGTYSQLVNTNLEQVSDWLTKIIVGFGLIELRKVPGAFQSLAEYMANDSTLSPSFAGSIVVYFGVAGFFSCYLLTRLYLAGAFRRADQRFERGVEQLQDDEGTEIPTEIAAMIDTSPSTAVSLALTKLDSAVREATTRLGMEVPAESAAVYQQLANKGYLNPVQLQTAEQLKHLRVIATLEDDQHLKKEHAQKYVRTAIALAREVGNLGN